MPDFGTRPVVMKFGGTSVGNVTAILSLVDIVRSACQRTSVPPVVVVSAMSGVTDQLLALASAAERGDVKEVGDGLEALTNRHAATVGALLGHDAHPVRQQLADYLTELQETLSAISTLREASPRSRDAVAAMGELLSSRIVAGALERHGLPASWIDARQAIVTDDQYGSAAPLAEETDHAVRRTVRSALSDSLLPVVGGYVAASLDGFTTTLGRGGSDYSAAILGAALGAAEIQIWTDVDGMLTGDPRIIDAPRTVARLSFEEASELAYFGAKVLHPSTIQPAMRKDIPVRILNSRDPGRPGTLITRTTPEGGNPLTAIACKRQITVLDITSTGMLMAYGFLRRLFDAFERCRTPVDVVTTSEVSVSVTIDDDRRLSELEAAVSEFAHVEIARDMAIVCAVGDCLRQDSRIAARAIATLDGLPIRMISQAASRRNLTVVMSDEHVPAAMTRLHDEFFAPVAIAT